jgi:ABC-type nitrate/sulfonate/bicarbonate transport system substrate-binding protein
MQRLIFCIALTAAMLLSAAGPGGAAGNDKVRIVINPTVLGYLPVFVAIEKGYFARQHIDLDVKTTTQPTISTMPLLVRGDIDMVPLSVAPAFFNQSAAGFNVKIVSSIQSARTGYNDGVVLLVRQDVWDAGTVRKPSDLKGRVVDGLAPGSVTDMLMKEAVAAGHLTPADLTYGSRYRGVPDIDAGLHNKAVEVVSGFDPSATAFQAQNIAHKWITLGELMPWFQGSFWTASAQFISAHPDIVKRMLVAYLQGVRDVNRTNGHWTPEILAVLSKYSGLPVATLTQIPGPSYADPSGSISTYSLNRQEQAYINDGLVSKSVIVTDLIDTGPLSQARKAMSHK